jgi:hypothetical protein
MGGKRGKHMLEQSRIVAEAEKPVAQKTLESGRKYAHAMHVPSLTYSLTTHAGVPYLANRCTMELWLHAMHLISHETTNIP